MDKHNRRVGKGPYRSVLNPYIKEIMQWRNERKSFAEIAKLLEENFKLKVTPKSVWSFVKVRSTPPPPILNIHPAYLQTIPETKRENYDQRKPLSKQKENKQHIEEDEIDYKNITYSELLKIPFEKVNQKKLSRENPRLYGAWLSRPNGTVTLSESAKRSIESKKESLLAKVKGGVETVEDAQQALISVYEFHRVPYDFEKDINIFGKDK